MTKTLVEAVQIAHHGAQTTPTVAHLQAVFELLEEARAHLEYCGYGDRWEREASGDLRERLGEACEAV